MLKAAICDDDRKALSQIERYIEDYNKTHPEEVQFSSKTFVCPTALRDEVVDGEHFDTFILDIEMEGMDGFTLAREIREHLPTASIVFLSSHTEFSYAQEGYKVQALRYVSKLTMQATIEEALETAAEVSKTNETRFYIIQHYNDILRIHLDEIVYIHRVNRTTEIVTEKNGRPVIRKPLKDILRELDDKRFIYTDRSCIVNGDFVVSVQNNALCLRNGETLPISRKMMPNVKVELLQLWGNL